jgi:serine/threonine-protein kinase
MCAMAGGTGGLTPERWARLEELFHRTRALPADERRSFIDRACGTDFVLRQELQSLLAQPDGTLLTHGVGLAAAALFSPTERASYEGRTVGPYTLGPLIGRGGMGDVYRARDAKLGRDVAMKILPDSLARRPDRLGRFQREARILASLNHPHIGAIYGFEESDGISGLVLELVEGATLKDTLANGPLPVNQAVVIARQIAEALEVAHQKGVVHRDLKPANVTITPRGVVKVLDFGIAKIDGPAAGDAAVLPVLATGEGVVLGTVAYMSPEQARGHAVDKRTDIWAFGCVLFEMLTGIRTFPGESAADVLGAITSAEPDWALLPAATPQRVRLLLGRCLRKDPARRLHDIADARIELEDTLAGGAESVDTSRRTRRPRTMFAWVAVGTTAIAAAAVWIALSVSPAPHVMPEHVAIPLPDNLALWGIGRGSSVAVSPDGQRIAFVGLARGQRQQLFLRSIDAPASTPIAGTEGASNPVFSPDGQWIAFLDSFPTGELKKVSLNGDGPFSLFDTLGDGMRGLGATAAWWGPDDSIVFAVENPKNSGLWRISASGGTPRQLTTTAAGEGNHTWPYVLPNGKAVVYTIWDNTGFEKARIVLKPLPQGEPVVLAEGGSYGRVVMSADRAWLAYARNDVLYAKPFDIERLQITGAEAPVISGLFTNMSGGAHFSVSATGRLLYVPGRDVEREKTLLWVTRDGTATEIATLEGVSAYHNLSPDGRRLVTIRTTAGNRDLWVLDLTGHPPTRLTLGGVHNFPIWAGQRVIYSSGASKANLFWKLANPAAPEERLGSSEYQQIPGSVSPDGSTLAYSEDRPQTGRDIFLMSLREPGPPRLLVGTKAGEWKPTFSPDGRWIAYQSNVAGPGRRFRIYLASLADGRQFPVSDEGSAPLWSQDGRELYYSAAGNMMVLSIDTTGLEPQFSKPRVLFSLAAFYGDGQIAPDGRFFFLKATPREASSRFIQVVSNWFEELRVKVPAQ